MRIERQFFERDTVTVARELLGQVLVHETQDGTTRGIIVETEAYLGQADAAAHSYKGSRDRVRVQYGPSGCAYVYLIYGMYCCMNITSGHYGVPEVVLLRALEPSDGIDLMMQRRKTENVKKLCSGPGKLCMAMGIDRRHYGNDLCAKNSLLYCEYGSKPCAIATSKRINIDYSGEAKDYLLRFTVEKNAFLSK